MGYELRLDAGSGRPRAHRVEKPPVSAQPTEESSDDSAETESTTLDRQNERRIGAATAAVEQNLADMDDFM